MKTRRFRGDLFLVLGSVYCLGLSLALGQSSPADPEWWSSGSQPVLTQDNAKNYAPATIGQAKWFTKRALETLDEVVPTVADDIRADLVGATKIIPSLDPPGSPTQAWYDEQKKVLQVGQLKAIAKEFYDALYTTLDNDANEWLKDEMDLYETRQGSGYYPWSGTAKDYAPANLGQLKAVFALRFTASLDGDDAPDLLEHAALDTTDFPITEYQDGDGDGKTDIEELQDDLDAEDRDVDGDGDADDVDDNLFQEELVRGINGFISPGVNSQKEFWANPGETDIELFYWRTKDDDKALTVTATANSQSLTATATKINDWEYELKVTPDNWSDVITITVKYDGTTAWTESYLPNRINGFGVSQPMAAITLGNPYVSNNFESTTYGSSETYTILRSEGGDYSITASYDVERASNDFKLVVCGMPDRDAISASVGDTSEELTFQVSSFALSFSQISVALVRDSNDEVIYRTPVSLGSYGLLTGWQPDYMFDGSTLPSPDPKCAECSDSYTNLETDPQLPKQSGEFCMAGYTTFESTSDNKVEATTSLGSLANGEGLAQMGFRGDNIGGSAEGGGSSLPATQDPVKPHSLQFSGTESAAVTLDSTNSYPVQVTTATGVTKVDQIVSDGYRISFYRPNGTTLETRLTIKRPSNTSGEPQELRYIEERFSTTAGSTGSIVETKYSQLVNSDGSVTWAIYEGAELANTTSVADEEDFLRKTVIEVSAERNQIRTEKVTVYEMPADVTPSVNNWEKISCFENHYRRYSWGDPIFRRVEDPGGRHLASNWSYHTDAVDGCKRGQPKSFQDHTGDWAEFEWDSHGRLSKVTQPFKDSTQTNGDKKTFNVSYSGTTAPLTRRDTTKIGTTAVGEHYVTGSYTSRSMTRVETVGTGTTGLTTTITRGDVDDRVGDQYHKFEADSYQVTAIDYPDGTTYSCSWSYDDATRLRTCKRGNSALTRGMKTVTETDLVGNVLVTEKHALDFQGSTGVVEKHLSTVTLSVLDGLQRPTKRTTDFKDSAADQVESWIYGCCGMNYRTDLRGVTTEYHHDHLKRLETTTSLSVSRGTQFNGLERTVLRFPDPGGSEHVTVRGTTYPTGTIVRSIRTYNCAGELLSRKSASPQQDSGTVVQQIGWMPETTYAYSYGAGVTTTVNNPDGGQATTQTHRDGRTYSVLGTAVNDREYEYGTSLADVTMSNGAVFGVKTIEANDTQWAAEMVNILGQPVLSYYANDATATRYYNSRGQLEKTVDPDEVKTFFTYNDEGEAVFTILKTDGTDSIDWENDRITFSQGNYTDSHTGSYYCYEVESQAFVAGDDPEPSADPAAPAAPSGLVVSRSQRSIDSLRSWTISYPAAVDGQSNPARVANSVTTLAGSGAWDTYSKAIDGRKSWSEYDYGLLGKQTVWGDADNDDIVDPSEEILSETTIARDDHNRVDSVTDGRTGENSISHYYSDGIKDSTLLRGVGAGDDLESSYEYDVMGRTVKTKLPDSLKEGDQNPTANVIVRTYDERGNVRTTTGEQTYDRTYTYDGLSRLLTLVTTHGGGAGEDQTTTWSYHDDRGWLENKRYDDNKGPDYTYTDAGRLATRKWARGGAGTEVTTTYAYQAGSGDLLTVTYSNDGGVTPDLTYVYERWGALSAVDDITGRREFTYRETVDLFIDTEVLSASGTGYPTPVVNMPKKHTHSYDDLGRLKELQWGNSTSATADHVAGYAYDANTGRLATASHGPIASSTDTFAYAYEADSNLVSTIIGPEHTVTSTYEDHRDLRTRLQSNDGTNDQIDYQYAYNNIAQRDAISFGGDALDGADDNADEDGSWVVEYNANGEVALTDRHDDVSLTPTGTKTNDRDYAYDPIGNRISFEVTSGGSTDTWDYYGNAGETEPGGDSLNQYRRIDTPSGDLDRVHDDDGNLTDDGTLLYKWDAENRLIEVRKKSGNTLIAEYRYDYMGRRVWKEVHSTATGGVIGEDIFAYCGWNLAAEYEATSAKTIGSTTSPQRTYTWGLDLSGSLQGAGGVGGLLAIEEESGTYAGLHFPAYDGNGNVVAILDDSTGDDEAWYVYDGFGQDFDKSTTGYTTENPMRFSTKYFDRETGLYYYGYRYYQPDTGRWLSRDPIEEFGGINLYAVTGNDFANQWDSLGLETSTEKANRLVGKPVDCDCYTISAKFSRYNRDQRTVKGVTARGQATEHEEYGADVRVSLSAAKRKIPGCECKCDRVKVVQFTNTGTKHLIDWRRRRTVGGWRIDSTEKNPKPFVSDTGNGGARGLGGWVNDPPGAFTRNTGMVAYTCLICASGKERGNIIGCVRWGFTARKSQADKRKVGAMIVVLHDPKIVCGKSMGNIKRNAIAGWDRQWKTNEDRKNFGFWQNLK